MTGQLHCRTVSSWNGDDHYSVVGRTSAGELKIYHSNGQSGWQNPSGTIISSGWGGFATILSPGDWNGDNAVDILAITTAGDLRMYTTDGTGNWINPDGQTMDTGWNTYNLIF